jgi:Xaa-Pro aminopeptidase
VCVCGGVGERTHVTHVLYLEYVPAAYMRRAFLSGFAGSAGTAVVTHEAAYLWTDSRYWNEASLQLDASVWTLQKAGIPTTLTIPAWLAETAMAHQSQPLRVGLDPYVHAASFAKEVSEAWDEAAKDIDQDPPPTIGVLVTEHENLIDPIWGDDQPAIPTSPFRVHPLEYAGVTMADKVTKIRQEMKAKKASLAVFCSLDDVVYLLNVRAKGDVDTCPVGIAYVTVSMDQVKLYCDAKKVASDDVKEHLREVVIMPYEDIVPDLAAHCEATPRARVWLDTSRANLALANVIPKKCLLDQQNAVVPMKACKNEAELQGIRQAHVVDGAAMAEFMAWLEQAICSEQRSVTEVEIDERLTACRAKQPGFVELSFPTIAGVGSNGAIIHYRASADSPLMQSLDRTQPILLDSGAQYTYGTTDVTRTWFFGDQASAEFVDGTCRSCCFLSTVDSLAQTCSVLSVHARPQRSHWTGSHGVSGKYSGICLGCLCASSLVGSRQGLWPRHGAWGRCCAQCS